MTAKGRFDIDPEIAESLLSPTRTKNNASSKRTAHLKSFSVKAGEIAERGQKIGEVGTTGFSTGPHLHFMMSYYSMNLEPGYFLVGQPITYENYQKFISGP